MKSDVTKNRFRDADPPPPRKVRSGVRWAWWDFIFPLLLAIGISAWMTAGDRELGWQKAFVDASGEWVRGEAPFWRFLYHFGPAPVLVVCLLALAGLLAGFRFPRWRRWRRVLAYPILLLMLAPGLMANLIFKEHWGRPRPREVLELGGRYPFETVFERLASGDGKSFPCGHATMGFFFFAGYFLLRRVRPAWSAFFLSVALGWGALIGYARMMQGGHFATDVVWAAAIVFLCAAGLFHGLGLNRRLLDDLSAESQTSRIPLKVKLGAGALLVGMFGAIALGTPFRDRRDHRPLHPAAAELSQSISFTSVLGDVSVVPGEVFSIKGQAWGHGVPTSGIADRWNEEIAEDGTLKLDYRQRKSGHMTEVHQQLRVTIPWGQADFVRFILGPGDVRVFVPISGSLRILELQVDGADLEIALAPGVGLAFPDEWADSVRDETGDGGVIVLGSVKTGTAGLIPVKLSRFEGGSIRVLRNDG